MSMPIINLGDKQPVPCVDCGFAGYQQSDYIKTHYTQSYDENGKMLEGWYSDFQPVITNGKIAYCANCSERLKFKFRRDIKEESKRFVDSMFS